MFIQQLFAQITNSPVNEKDLATDAIYFFFSYLMPSASLYHWVKQFRKDSILLWRTGQTGELCLETGHIPFSTQGSDGWLFKKDAFAVKV